MSRDHITKIVRVQGNQDFAVAKELGETKQKAYAEVASPDPINADEVIAKNLVSDEPVEKKKRNKGKSTEVSQVVVDTNVQSNN